MSVSSSAGAGEYHSKDFEWETLKQEIENDPSLQYHLLPYNSSPEAAQEAEQDSDAWKRFHSRHSSGKFFKVCLSFCFYYSFLIILFVH